MSCTNSGSVNCGLLARLPYAFCHACKRISLPRVSTAASGVEDEPTRLCPPAYATAEGTGHTVPITTSAMVIEPKSNASKRPFITRPTSHVQDLLHPYMPRRLRVPSVSYLES